MEFSYRISEAQYAQAWKLRRAGRSAQATLRTVVFWVFIVICLLILWAMVSKSAHQGKVVEYGYSDLYQKVENDQVLEATIEGNTLRGRLKASPQDEFDTALPYNHDDLTKAMLAHGVTFTIKPGQNNTWLVLLINIGPAVAIIAAWIFILRRMGPWVPTNPDRVYRNDPVMQGEFTVNIAPVGISIRNTAGTSSQSGWNVYEYWREGKDLIVLKSLSPGQLMINVAGLTEIQRQEIRSTLASVLPKK